MRSKALATCAVAALLGLVSPVFAADQPDPNFVLPKLHTVGPMHNYVLFAPLPPGQQAAPAAPAAQNQRKQLTTAGKVLKWVGVGLMAEGGLDFALGAAASNTVCTNYNFSCVGSSTVRDVYFGLGGVAAGVGAALFFVGIHKTQ